MSAFVRNCALLGGREAWLLSRVVRADEVERRLRAAGFGEAHVEPVMDALAAVHAAGNAWHAEMTERAAARGSAALPQAEGPPPSPAMTETVTTREAAALLGRSERRVRQLIDCGDLPARRRGRDWLVDRAAATALAAAKEEA